MMCETVLCKSDLEILSPQRLYSLGHSVTFGLDVNCSENDPGHVTWVGADGEDTSSWDVVR